LALYPLEDAQSNFSFLNFFLGLLQSWMVLEMALSRMLDVLFIGSQNHRITEC